MYIITKKVTETARDPYAKLQGCMKFVYLINPVHSVCSKEDIVESFVMKNPVATPAVVGTTDGTCSVSLFLQLVRVAYPKIKVS